MAVFTVETFGSIYANPVKTLAGNLFGRRALCLSWGEEGINIGLSELEGYPRERLSMLLFGSEPVHGYRRAWTTWVA